MNDVLTAQQFPNRRDLHTWLSGAFHVFYVSDRQINEFKTLSSSLTIFLCQDWGEISKSGIKVKAVRQSSKNNNHNNNKTKITTLPPTSIIRRYWHSIKNFIY